MVVPIPEPYLHTARIRSHRFMTQIVLINADLTVPGEFFGHPWPSWHSLRQRPHLIPDYEAAAHLAKLIGDKTWLRQAERLPFIADRRQLLLRLRPLKGARCEAAREPNQRPSDLCDSAGSYIRAGSAMLFRRD